MQVEVFETEREFNKKFPSGFYVCPICGYMTNDKYNCPRCEYSASGLFKTLEKGYKYRIVKTDIEEEIFKPIELEKGQKNE